MESFLKNIALETAERVKRSKARFSIDKIKDAISSSRAATHLDFAEAIFSKKNSSPAIIAESKKASPSAGTLRPIYNVKEIVSSYIAGGAKAISILTEENHFLGDLYHLLEARETATDTPILRKDFIIDEYQIYESRYYGADAILLIKALLPDEKFYQLSEAAHKAGIEVLAEARNEKELSFIINSKTKCVVGVNSRDLDNFNINLDKTAEMLSGIPSDIAVVVESGIKSAEDIVRMLKIRKSSPTAFLIGTSLITCADPGARLKEIINKVKYIMGENQ